MSYKSLLAYIEPSSRNRPVMETGLRLASACEAHLTALHVHVPTPIAYPEYSEFPMVNDLQTLRHEDEEAKNFETRLKAEFNDLAGRSGAVSVEWRFVGGDLVETLVLHARYADLLVMRQHHPQTHIRSSGYDVPASVALLSARPVLVLPYSNDTVPIGKRIAVAWNASREATLAITLALPLLIQAKAVTVIVVKEDKHVSGIHENQPGADVSLYLARHGVNASVKQVNRGALSVGEALLSAVAEDGADLLCIGAYGHPRWREMVFGGVTFELMRHMTIPTLIAS